MPANAVKLINLPGVAVKATISNIVWVGGEINSIFTKLAFYVLFAWGWVLISRQIHRKCCKMDKFGTRHPVI